MKTKKLLLIGALALVITCCVLAAGCTSTETTATDDASTDAIVGVWFSDSDKGKATKIILADGTGYSFVSNANGTAKVCQLTWKKNADGTYVIAWSDGSERTWTPTSAKDTMTSSSGATQVKKSLDEDAMKILGVWYKKDKDAIFVFNADSTGIFKHNNGVAPFTWKLKDNGKYELTYTDGTWGDGTDAKGKVTEWTYDGDNNAIISSSNSKYVRPSESVNGKITLTTFSTEPIVGQWTAKYQNDGKTVDAVLILGNDGNGYWATMGDVEGIQLTDIEKDTWKNTGDNTYQITDSTAVYDMVYDTASDALKGKRIVYTRLEPIVGIWSSTLAGEKSNTASHLFKPDGTGVATVAYDDGTAKVVKMTWKKNNDGTYAIVYSDGDKGTYTIDAAGTTITTGNGATKTKLLYRDMTLLSSIIGAWYNKDNDVSYVFNADGTGFGSWENGDVLPFTWEAKGDGIFELTYISGTWSDGTSAKGKVTKWTYDRDNDVFTSSADIEYIRPTESVNGKITLYS